MSSLDELTDIIASQTGASKSKSRETVKAVLAHISDTVKAGNEINLVGFGTFKQADRAARTGRNPSTGETLDIPARKAVKFKASKNFL